MALWMTAGWELFLTAAFLLFFSCGLFHGSMGGGMRKAEAVVFVGFLSGLLFMELETTRFQKEGELWETTKEEIRIRGRVEVIEEREEGYRLILRQVSVENAAAAGGVAEGGFEGNLSEEDVAAAGGLTESVVSGKTAKEAGLEGNIPAESLGTVRRVFCYTDRADGLKIGREICAFGTGEEPAPATNPGGFDYRLYCRGKGIGGAFYADRYEVTDEACDRMGEGLRQLRRLLSDRLQEIAPKEDAGILMAVLLGDRTWLEDSVYELYRKNGISHLLAISGLHVSVIGMGIWKSFRKGGAGFWLSGGLAAGLLFLYGKMVGFGPSVVRAICMASLSFLAKAFGRTYDLPSAMCVPCFALLARYPYLLTQAGFQLSFLAIAAIFYPGSVLQRFSKGRPLFSAFSVSLSVQMVTAPAILYHSFELPPYGVFLNLAVIPLMTYVAVSGFAGLFGSFFWMAGGAAFLGGAHYVLRLYEGLCIFAGRLPFSNVVLGRPEFWQMALYYGCLLGGTVLLERYQKAGTKKEDKEKTGRKKNRKETGEETAVGGTEKKAEEGQYGQNGGREKETEAIGLLPAMGILIWAAGVFFLFPVRLPGLSVVFLDVGQGDGIYMEANGKTMLMDCGSSWGNEVGENCLTPFLKSRGVTRLDAVAVSHGDWDHISGIRYLLETPELGITIGRLILPEAGTGKIYEELCALAKRRGIDIEFLEAGDRLDVFGKSIQMECLYPEGDFCSEDRNEESLVISVQFGEFSMLLTGDVGISGEEWLLENGEIYPATVLKAAHHGSATSSGEDFVQAVRPVFCIFSYGEGNRYGHPHMEVTERFRAVGSEICRTAEMGAVEVRTDGKRIRVKGYRRTQERFP